MGNRNAPLPVAGQEPHRRKMLATCLKHMPETLHVSWLYPISENYVRLKVSHAVLTEGKRLPVESLETKKYSFVQPASKI